MAIPSGVLKGADYSQALFSDLVNLVNIQYGPIPRDKGQRCPVFQGGSLRKFPCFNGVGLSGCRCVVAIQPLKWTPITSGVLQTLNGRRSHGAEARRRICSGAIVLADLHSLSSVLPNSALPFYPPLQRTFLGGVRFCDAFTHEACSLRLPDPARGSVKAIYFKRL